MAVGAGVAVGGTGVAVGGRGVAVGESGVEVGDGSTPPHAANTTMIVAIRIRFIISLSFNLQLLYRRGTRAMMPLVTS